MHPAHGTLALTPELSAPPPCRYDQGGATVAAEALSRQGGGGGRSDRRVTIAQIKDEGLGFGEKPDWVQVGGWGGGPGPAGRAPPGRVELGWQRLAASSVPA